MIATSEDLAFLLYPTSNLVSFLTGFKSVYIEQNGYFFQGLNILIDKSCSGFNFWLICFFMLSFLTINFFKNKLLAILISLVSGYLFSVLVNSSRIFTLIILQNQNSSFTNNSIIHESVGVITNLTFLILIYLIVEKTLTILNRNAKLT